MHLHFFIFLFCISLTDVLQDAKRHLGVLLLLPPSVSESRQHPSNRLRLTKPPVQVLKKMAEVLFTIGIINIFMTQYFIGIFFWL